MRRSSLEDLRGIGKVTATRLRAAGVANPVQLACYLPRGWRTFARRSDLSDEDFGVLVEVHARCLRARTRPGRVPCCEARFELVDATGDVRQVVASFFGNRHLAAKLAGEHVWRVRGRVAARQKLAYRLEAAEVARSAASAEQSPVRASGELRYEPRYPRIAGVPDRTLRTAIEDALRVVHDERPDATRADPHERAELLESLRLPSLVEALIEVHRPSHDPERLESARRRVALFEARAVLRDVRKRRERWRTRRAFALPSDERLLARVRARLPFAPSSEQERCITEILEDLARERPMARLLQGDVGSGKTLVAMAAALVAGAAQKQTALLAPTTMLARQHVTRFSERLAGSRLPVIRFLQGMSKRERAEALARFRTGEPCIAIGTHALLGKDVEFGALGLMIVDEQQRFGVGQRGALFTRAGDVAPHVLVMSATPIPRSYANALFGDLDLSELRALPTSRPPVQTSLCIGRDWPEICEAIRHEVDRGGRVYVVCPRIGPSTDLEDAETSNETRDDDAADDAALTTFTELSRIVPSLLVHGRMDTGDVARAQDAFRSGSVRCLVATTVVEVGLDVPEATWMVVRGADRLGLSQLHQLRGRVGRGQRSGRCLLVTDTPNDRLRILEKSSDGFEIAEADWQQRGSGDLAGSLQHGHLRFRCLDLARDLDLLRVAAREETAFSKGVR
ncbi:MAG: DEAD/DEAH box helicase [Planctomycetes bacterium]|nr:DEAD/DEAH box helicase [Planctomycetota bacterium]